MKQFLTKFLKDKNTPYNISIIQNLFYFIVNIFFIPRNFFKLRRLSCWVRPPSLCPSLSGFLQPPSHPRLERPL